MVRAEMCRARHCRVLSTVRYTAAHAAHRRNGNYDFQEEPENKKVWLYTHRATGGNRHYRCAGRVAAAGGRQSAKPRAVRNVPTTCGKSELLCTRSRTSTSKVGSARVPVTSVATGASTLGAGSLISSIRTPATSTSWHAPPTRCGVRRRLMTCWVMTRPTRKMALRPPGWPRASAARTTGPVFRVAVDRCSAEPTSTRMLALL